MRIKAAFVTSVTRRSSFSAIYLILLDLMQRHSYAHPIEFVQQVRQVANTTFGVPIMKTIARFFVLALAVTGLAASSQISPAANAKNTVSVAKTSAAPTPMCPPDDPNGCNIRGGW